MLAWTVRYEELKTGMKKENKSVTVSQTDLMRDNFIDRSDEREVGSLTDILDKRKVDSFTDRPDERV